MEDESKSTEDIVRLNELVRQYFKGLHYADVGLLKSIFHPSCVLAAPGIRRSRDDWLALVQSREVPAQRAERPPYRVLSLECLGEQALAKVYCPLLGDQFIDYLGLLKEDGRWTIVNKMYAPKPAYY